MKKLLKIYSLQSDLQYFEMVAESFTNGQISQAKAQFKAMPKAERVAMLKAATSNWDSGMSQDNLAILFNQL
jgi:hypothetical protein